MSIVGGFDVHRQQITFDYVDADTGQVLRGQVRPATRMVLRSWLGQRFAGRADVEFAVEGCTGWRFVAEELARSGVTVHLAEPADTATLRGRKKRAKTDRADSRLLRELLDQDRLPESWVPPTHVLEVRTLGRLYCALMDQRRAWQQRIHAQLFHQGVPPVRGLLTEAGRAALAQADLSPAGRQMVDTALTAIDSLTELITPLRRQLIDIARAQPGCRALQHLYGVGWLTARTTPCVDWATRRSPQPPPGRWRPDGTGACPAHQSADACGQLPPAPCRHRRVGGRPEKNERPHPSPGTPHTPSRRRAHHARVRAPR
jgi:transposase